MKKSLDGVLESAMSCQGATCTFLFCEIAWKSRETVVDATTERSKLSQKILQFFLLSYSYLLQSFFSSVKNISVHVTTYFFMYTLPTWNIYAIYPSGDALIHYDTRKKLLWKPFPFFIFSLFPTLCIKKTLNITFKDTIILKKFYLPVYFLQTVSTCAC